MKVRVVISFRSARKIVDAWTEGTVYRIAFLKERGLLP